MMDMTPTRPYHFFMQTIRLVTPSDLDLVCRHRAEMFREAGRDDGVLAAMAVPFRRWLEPKLADGSYFGFVAQHDENPIAAIGLMEIDWPPHPSHPMDTRRGYILNLFVERRHRGKGIGRRLMEAADQEFARRAIRFVILHATEQGRPLYEKIGWSATSEMAKSLPGGLA
jgi:GNAT superfamily N-acetyltransferase